MRVQLCGSCPNGICGKRVNAPHELSVKASEQYIASRCAASEARDSHSGGALSVIADHPACKIKPPAVSASEHPWPTSTHAGTR